MDNYKPYLLLTGINGFLGSYLAKTLIEDYNLVGIESSLHNTSRINDILDRIQLFVDDEDSLKRIYLNLPIDIVIHTATRFGKNNDSVMDVAKSNLLMPLSVLDASIKNNAKVFINADTIVNKYVNEYSLFKRQFHEWLLFNKGKIKIINIEMEHIFGEDASNANFISYIINKLLRNENEILLTKGEQKRDFIYIEDVVEAYKLILKNISSSGQNYSLFHICTGEKITIKEIVEYLKSITNSKSKLNFGAIPYRKYELMDTSTENSAISMLGWKPKVSLKDGMIRTVNYYKKIIRDQDQCNI